MIGAMKIAVSCGGTGGHMYPGLAVAAELLARGHEVGVVLSGRSVESERTGGGLPRGAAVLPVRIPRPSARRPLSVFAWVGASLPARRALRAFRADALLAMGSYTSLPPVLAARSLGIPVVLHEANAVPGKAVARLARFARAVCVCFPGMENRFAPGTRLVKTGLPLRSEFARGVGASAPSDGAFRLLVMGGSQGAKGLNRLVAEAFGLAARTDPAGLARRRVKIVHLAGRAGEEEARALWAASGAAERGVGIEVVGFESDMARRYAEADACVSRAGASSCFELALAGVPAVFVPLPHLAGDHQSRNAEAFAGAADLVSQEDPDAPAKLLAALFALADDPALRAARREKMLAFAPDAPAARVAAVLERLPS